MYLVLPISATFAFAILYFVILGLLGVPTALLALLLFVVAGIAAWWGDGVENGHEY